MRIDRRHREHKTTLSLESICRRSVCAEAERTVTDEARNLQAPSPKLPKRAHSSRATGPYNRKPCLESPTLEQHPAVQLHYVGGEAGLPVDCLLGGINFCSIHLMINKSLQGMLFPEWTCREI